MFMGMNRNMATDAEAEAGVPHVHGDEPVDPYQITIKDGEFPMFKGMNRRVSSGLIH